MRLGILVDGQAEFRALPELLPKIESPHTLLAPLYADIQPFAPIPQIVGAVRTKLPILRGRRAERVLVLLDMESRAVCPGVWAGDLEAALNRDCTSSGIQQFYVVVKNSCFENWLVSDITALQRMPKRFSLSATTVRSIQPNKADRVNAQRILETAAQGDGYSKTADAVRILSLAEPLAIAANSRSFRRFLRRLDHPRYLDQSIAPVD